jgi:hypothetical protein
VVCAILKRSLDRVWLPSLRSLAFSARGLQATKSSYSWMRREFSTLICGAGGLDKTARSGISAVVSTRRAQNYIEDPHYAGYWAVDTSIFKNIRLSDRFRLQFRAEAFNIFNHTNFQLGGATGPTGTNRQAERSTHASCSSGLSLVFDFRDPLASYCMSHAARTWVHWSRPR